MFGVLKRLVFLAMIVCMMASYAQAATDYSGWWWNSAESGTGYSLEVQCDKAYIVWYLYEEGGLNTWYSAILDVDGDTMTGDLYIYDGWPLEAGYDASSETTAELLGEVTLEFSDDDNGTLTYTPDGGGANVVRTLERRLLGDSDPRNLDGWWWDTDQQGIGWFFEAKNDEVNGEVMSVGWYNYRAQAARAGGDPRFFVTWADFASTDTTYTAGLIDAFGGQTLTGDYVAPSSTDYGTLELDIPANFDGDADGASLEFTLGGNSYTLTRFDIPGKTCDSGDGCAPEVTFNDPTADPGRYIPNIQVTFETECGSTIDPDTFQMTVTTVPDDPTAETTVATKVPTSIKGEGDKVQFRYQYTQEDKFDPYATIYVKVYVEDEYGNGTEFEWTFPITFYIY